jgi:hypothetical protein
VKGAKSKLAAKIAIIKETNSITQRVNIYRATKEVPPLKGFLVIFNLIFCD